MTGCRDYRPLLGMFAVDRLDDAETATLHGHLDTCGDCWADLSELCGVVEALGQVDLDRLAP